MDRRIGIIIRSLKPGGAEKQSALLASVLARYYKVCLFIQYNEISNSNQSLIQHPNIQLIPLKGNILSKTKQLRNTILTERISHVFAYLSSDNLIASLAAINIKTCAVYGGVRSSSLPKHKSLVLCTLHHFFQKGTIFNNYTGLNIFLKRGFSKHKSHVIPNGIELNQAPPGKGDSSSINIISVGRFVEAKDYATALQAIDKTRQMTSKAIKYYIIGFGPLENAIRSLIADLQLNEYVKVIINPDNVNAYYQLADIYLCTSSFEGLSNSIMEAINYFLPIVATDVGDNNKLVINRSNGYLTKPGNTAEISDALIHLIDDTNLRVQFGHNGFSHLKKHYALDPFADSYINLIENETYAKT